jgi:hypothetical protein
MILDLVIEAGNPRDSDRRAHSDRLGGLDLPGSFGRSFFHSLKSAIKMAADFS